MRALALALGRRGAHRLRMRALALAFARKRAWRARALALAFGSGEGRGRSSASGPAAVHRFCVLLRGLWVLRSVLLLVRTPCSSSSGLHGEGRVGYRGVPGHPALAEEWKLGAGLHHAHHKGMHCALTGVVEERCRKLIGLSLEAAALVALRRGLGLLRVLLLPLLLLLILLHVLGVFVREPVDLARVAVSVGGRGHAVERSSLSLRFASKARANANLCCSIAGKCVLLYRGQHN